MYDKDLCVYGKFFVFQVSYLSVVNSYFYLFIEFNFIIYLLLNYYLMLIVFQVSVQRFVFILYENFMKQMLLFLLFFG